MGSEGLFVLYFFFILVRKNFMLGIIFVIFIVVVLVFSIMFGLELVFNIGCVISFNNIFI